MNVESDIGEHVVRPLVPDFHLIEIGERVV